jgi:PAS domain-containing protein
MATEFNTIEHMKRLAGSLAVPVFIVDPAGTLLYYNEGAEGILGRKFAETGELQASVWSRLFVPTDDNGDPLMPEQLPLMQTLNDRRPATGRFWIRGLDNESRHIEVSSFPLTGQPGTFLGAVAMFWEVR